jgi:Putative polyhydroxyalkanoic acid system protein (PHA_gran_rgn)
MANLEMTIPHSLPQEEAIKRIKNQFTEMKNNHGDKIKNLKEDWNGNVGNFSFSFQGFDISGILTVDHSSVELDGKIPVAVSLFKEAIKKTIYDKAVEVLS